MHDDTLAEIESATIEACLSGGTYLRSAFRSEDTEADRTGHDVKSSADVESETRMLDVIRTAFPDHHVYAEGSGDHEGDGDYRWIVDPLDGTNNFESGLSSFASAATVLRDGRPRVAAAYVPLLDDLYVGRRGEGVRYNGRRVTGENDVPPSKSTVVSVIGHDVKLDVDRRAVSESINRGIESACKRRIETWSPVVHWGLLARGKLEGIVSYRPDREEQLLGELFAREAGLRIEEDEHWFVAAGNEALREELVEITAGAVAGE